MAEVTVPAVVSSRITLSEVEIWAPGQVVLRERSGGLSDALLRARPRWRGMLQIGRMAWRGSELVRDPAKPGDYLRRSRRDQLAAVEQFIAEMSRPGSWCNMPWGSNSVPARYRVPSSAMAPGVPHVSAVTKAQTADAGFEVAMAATAQVPLVAGDWICAHAGGPNILHCAIVTEAGAGLTVRSDGTYLQQGIRTVPDLRLAVGANVYGGDFMRMQFSVSGDSTITLPRGGGLAGPWTLQWEEHLG